MPDHNSWTAESRPPATSRAAVATGGEIRTGDRADPLRARLRVLHIEADEMHAILGRGSGIPLAQIPEQCGIFLDLPDEHSQPLHCLRYIVAGPLHIGVRSQGPACACFIGHGSETQIANQVHGQRALEFERLVLPVRRFPKAQYRDLLNFRVKLTQTVHGDRRLRDPCLYRLCRVVGVLSLSVGGPHHATDRHRRQQSREGEPRHFRGVFHSSECMKSMQRCPA